MTLHDHGDGKDDKPEPDGKQAGTGDTSGEEEGSSANEGNEDHLKEDQKTTSH